MTFFQQLSKKHGRLLKLSCSALAVMLIAVAVPFLAGHAESDDGAVVTATDKIVSTTDSTVGGLSAEPLTALEGDDGTVTCTTGEGGVVTITGKSGNLALKREDIIDTPAWNASEIVIGSGISHIMSGAFEGNGAIQKITVQNTVSTLRENAFLSCYGVSEIRIYSNGMYLYENLFSSANNLRDVYFYGDSIKINTVITNVGDKDVKVHIPCHMKNFDTYITPSNAATLFKDATVDTYNLELRNNTDATCTHDGYSGDVYCTRCNEVLTEGHVIDALGHEWSDWQIVRDATETVPGEKSRECSRCHKVETEPIPVEGNETEDDKYEFTANSVFTWKKGSKGGIKVIVKNTKGSDRTTFDRFRDVYVDGTKLVRDTDYTANAGSVEITLSATYLKSLDTGDHTIKVQLSVASVKHSFRVSESGGTTDNPGTGESVMPAVFSLVLMMVAAYGAVYAFNRKRKIVG